jgi:hypothetical protein
VSVADALVQPEPWNDARSALVAATGCTSLYTITITATTTQTATITDDRGHSAQASVSGSWPGLSPLAGRRAARVPRTSGPSRPG